VQRELPLGTYHSHPEPYHARVQVIKLYYQGWNKLSISQVLHVSRPTVDLWRIFPPCFSDKEWSDKVLIAFCAFFCTHVFLRFSLVSLLYINYN
jgi:hypothetical protein